MNKRHHIQRDQLMQREYTQRHRTKLDKEEVEMSEKKIVLAGTMVIETNLTFQQAADAMALANKHPMAKEYDFHISSDLSGPGRWSLMADNIKLRADFLANPESFLVVV